MRFALASLVILSACAHAPVRAAKPVEPLSLTLRVSPRTGFAPLYVQAAIRVVDEGRALRCPQFNLAWNLQGEPGDSSGFPGDYCDEDGPRVHAPRPRLILLRYPGEWVIAAAMADQGLALSATETVTVIGRTEE